MLQDYKDKDLDFGLDAQALSELLAGDKEWAAEAIDAFGSTNGMYVQYTSQPTCVSCRPIVDLNEPLWLCIPSVNALAFICGVCIVCPGSALEKAGRTLFLAVCIAVCCFTNCFYKCLSVVVFDALDFDATEQLSMDEMVRKVGAIPLIPVHLFITTDVYTHVRAHPIIFSQDDRVPLRNKRLLRTLRRGRRPVRR